MRLWIADSPGSLSFGIGMATILTFFALRDGQVVLLELKCGLLAWWCSA